MSATGIILFILFVIGVIVGIYYGFLYYQSRSIHHKTPCIEMGALIQNEDLNGNHESSLLVDVPSAPSPSKLDEPDAHSYDGADEKTKGSSNNTTWAPNAPHLNDIEKADDSPANLYKLPSFVEEEKIIILHESPKAKKSSRATSQENTPQKSEAKDADSEDGLYQHKKSVEPDDSMNSSPHSSKESDSKGEKCFEDIMASIKIKSGSYTDMTGANSFPTLPLSSILTENKAASLCEYSIDQPQTTAFPSECKGPIGFTLPMSMDASAHPSKLPQIPSSAHKYDSIFNHKHVTISSVKKNESDDSETTSSTSDSSSESSESGITKYPIELNNSGLSAKLLLAGEFISTSEDAQLIKFIDNDDDEEVVGVNTRTLAKTPLNEPSVFINPSIGFESFKKGQVIPKCGKTPSAEKPESETLNMVTSECIMQS